eukprot:NODE_1573_length_1368_cov_31.018196_g1305_i0.p1 GENE.NODE_1573_length_1368_cov_31.018196_g1305_i0~~NODE_1573_length_1368_cov_31.018196_g1305_i0.p1  ORF type:complete len:324 (+),score=51.09 NODE_1573_length_1368_cov_31.018196_g1305_i0:353-1324(+)
MDHDILNGKRRDAAIPLFQVDGNQWVQTNGLLSIAFVLSFDPNANPRKEGIPMAPPNLAEKNRAKQRVQDVAKRLPALQLLGGAGDPDAPTAAAQLAISAFLGAGKKAGQPGQAQNDPTEAAEAYKDQALAWADYQSNPFDKFGMFDSAQGRSQTAPADNAANPQFQHLRDQMDILLNNRAAHNEPPSAGHSLPPVQSQSRLASRHTAGVQVGDADWPASVPRPPNLKGFPTIPTPGTLNPLGHDFANRLQELVQRQEALEQRAERLRVKGEGLDFYVSTLPPGQGAPPREALVGPYVPLRRPNASSPSTGFPMSMLPAPWPQ